MTRQTQGKSMKIKNVYLILSIIFLTSCATIEKTQITKIKEKSKFSKTLSENKRTLKRKVAIARFTNESKYGQSFFLDSDNDRIGKQAVDILSSKLVQTEKFMLLERADLDKIKKELQMGDYKPLQNMADYLIVGSVTEFGRKNQGKVGIFSRTKRQIAFAKVHVRLIEVSTGKILYSEEGQGESFTESGSIFGIGERAGYDSSLNDKALESAINNLASNIIENLLDQPWKSFILGHDNGMIIIAGGKSQNINIGDKFNVIKLGKKVKNPQTNMEIRLPGKKIAEIKASMLTGDTPGSELTICEIIDGDLSIYMESGNFNNLIIQE